MSNENEEQDVFLGARIDERSDEEKAKDFKFAEIVVSAALVNWIQKEETRRFPIFDQDGSGSCVAQTVAKMAGIMYAQANDDEYVHFSATHVYQRRWNKPSGGMNGVDALDIARQGVTLEQLVPSQRMTDNQMDSAVIEKYKQDVGKIFGWSNYVILPNKDIDAIASVIQETGKGVMVWFYFNYKEWKRDMPTVIDKNMDLRGGSTLRHSVTAVDYTLLPDGSKALIIEDSWGNDTGIEGQRIITEDFFKARNWFAAHAMNFAFENPYDSAPGGNFTRNLEFTEEVTQDDDVVDLQNILKYEGMFPANVQSTGYYGNITAKAVLAWQLKFMPEYGENELIALAGKIVGPATRAALNKKYNK